MRPHTFELAGYAPNESTAPRVYSYTRFSTPEQAQGDSLRRQSDAALRWTERKNAERAHDAMPPVSLDESLRLHDLGVSAYRGANTAKDRALGGFLFACREGLIPSGSYLLVESFDRVSRQSPRRVVPHLNEIVDAGVTLVTLNDGREYDAATLDADPFALMIAFMVSIRSYEESRTKGQRLAAAWIEKRRRVRDGTAAKLTAKGPSWLQWTPNGWQERTPHADTVRRVFRMTLEGVGEHKIAATFNAEGVGVMGRGAMWHRSTVSKILRSPATIGDLVPGRIDHSGGRAVRVLEQPIPGAYPAVISRADWVAVRALKDGKAPSTRGRGAAMPVKSIFAGLARCPECGSAMTRVMKGSGSKGGKPKLACTRAKSGAAGHPYRSIDIEPLHGAFERGWQNLVADIPAGDLGGTLDGERRDLEGAIDQCEQELETLHRQLERAPSNALGARIRGQEAALASYRASLEAVEHQQACADHGIVATRVSRLADMMQGDRETAETLPDLGRINAALRALFEGVTVDYREARLRFHWRQGGETAIVYGWPMDAA